MTLTWALKNVFGRDSRGCLERSFETDAHEVELAPTSHTAWASSRDSWWVSGAWDWARLVVRVLIEVRR